MHRHRKVTVYEKHMNIRCDKVVYTTIHFVNCMHWVNILNFKSSLSCFGKTFWTETRNWIESNGLQLDVRWNDWTISYLELKFISALDCGGNWTVSSKSNSAKGPINVWKYKTRKKGSLSWESFCGPALITSFVIDRIFSRHLSRVHQKWMIITWPSLQTWAWTHFSRWPPQDDPHLIPRTLSRSIHLSENGSVPRGKWPFRTWRWRRWLAIFTLSLLRLTPFHFTRCSSTINHFFSC